MNSNDIDVTVGGTDLTISSDNVIDNVIVEENPYEEIPYEENPLWVLCENEDCYGLNYKKFLKEKMNICEYCGFHLKMSSFDRLELSIDPGTWNPLNEDLFSLDPFELSFDPEREPFEYDEVELSEEFNSDDELSDEQLSEVNSEEELEEFNSDDELSDEQLSEVNSEEEPSEEKPSEKEPSEEKPSEKELSEEQKTLQEKILSEFEERFNLEFEKFQSEREEEARALALKFGDGPSYTERLDSYQKETGLPDAIQTGTGQLNEVPIAIGVMEFEFMGGSMGSVVGEKITRLVEYATTKRLPIILVCASGGARMQEGSLSLMQMAKISAALYDYECELNNKSLYVPILTSPTTGGVMASFGMLGDIIIAEPDAYIAFAGKRVIEQTLNIIIPEGVQVADYLFEQGLFDSLVPRNTLKGILRDLFRRYPFFPLNLT
uniref:acetyl-CoA carboxylase subunit beta n=1 Tax=Filipendula palmata TaxID=1769926 RepID=UPI0023F061A5|nr:acetyl-CoA carboxylase subunit beta [Filipendula palmata]YP_010727153.1 acetyl-CoA carboxylase subunit beta [Filipendula intermedia]YP_010727233.1 acetyl-CoA carboxylase subunit beta [Filipendula nuda]YP_010727393.1 acetyl-CoA carboxylase subunit beta [Filipendula angustiloba]WDZ66575.1 acetyl-CoA carboxylase subunit beta [Filipendula palmata]WDZ66735.1 acetyl-CoA carboxylase subunit beta [Filipendula intermedia]WDZ66815.1 acetyl-CoA carboxylase subunit beta [Filipendula nuda]WDZ66975.1 a